jgi:hypothetical protein
MGAPKLKDTLARGNGGPKVFIDELEAQRLVMIYRVYNRNIKDLWYTFGNVLGPMVRGDNGMLLEHVPGLVYDPLGIRLPTGMRIYYPELQIDGSGFTYKSRRERKHIYGGKVVENVTQALARAVIAEHMLEIGKHYKVALQVHDEIVCVVPHNQANQAERDIKDIMSTPPGWAPSLPIACEIGQGESYGAC